MILIERTCIVCGAIFETTGAHDTCSDVCDWINEENQIREEEK